MRLNRGGFTLIELLVALMISGLLAGVMFQLLSGQGRFVELQSAREEVQQNSRAALDLIGNDLRNLPGGDALVVADDDSLTVRSARIWGIVCAVGGNTLDLALPAVPGASYQLNPGTGIVVNLGTSAAPIYTNAVAVTSIGGGATTCNGGAVAANSERRTITLAAMPQVAGTSPTVGSIAYLYDQVTYTTGTSAAVPGRWIQRRQGGGIGSAALPMAGPIEEDDRGLSFAYYAGSSSTPLATPISDAAVRASVTRVRVSVAAVSRNGSNGVREAKADTVVVTLKNRL